MARKKKHELALHTNEALFEVGRVGPLAAMEADRLLHRLSRPCVVEGCGQTVPCPHHGEPAEDHGEWLWSRRDGAA